MEVSRQHGTTVLLTLAGFIILVGLAAGPACAEKTEAAPPPPAVIDPSAKMKEVVATPYTNSWQQVLGDTHKLVDAAQFASAAFNPTTLPDDKEIRENTTFPLGAYEIDDANGNGALIVKADNIVIDCNYAVFRGKNKRGIGIINDGHDNVVLKHCAFEGYYQGVLFKNSSGHLIVANKVSGNYLMPVAGDQTDFLNVLSCPPSKEEGGGGIALDHVNNSLVRGNVAMHQQNGIGLYWSSQNVVEFNDTSDNEGWGLHLCEAQSNRLYANRSDNVYNRRSKYCHEVQQDGCDTASLLMMRKTNYNQVVGNSLKNSGDGLFLAGMPYGQKHGADYNYFLENDGSDAKHLSFEATFAVGNRFERNIAINAGRAAIWLGYSSDTQVLNNRVEKAAWNGIDIDHGQNIEIAGNTLINNGQNGIYLHNSEFLADEYAAPNGYKITGNKISDNRQYGISIDAGFDITINGNCMSGNRSGDFRLPEVDTIAASESDDC